MYYLVDGYNLLYQTSFISKEELVDTIDSFCQHLRRRAIVVFDGYSDENLDTPNVEVVFGGNADEEIKKIISENKNPSEITLISSDNDLIFAARSKKIKIIKSEDFDLNIATSHNDEEKETIHLTDDDVEDALEEFNHFKK